jgi:flagellar hook-associated protein 3 FlgL
MRITQRAVATTSLLGLNSNLAAVNKLQQQMTSGKTVSRPSDSPTGTNSSMYTRQDIASSAQQSRNITDGKTVLSATDTTLQGMLDQAHRVRDLTVQALNGGAMSDESLQAISAEVSGLRSSMLGGANQVVQGRALFGGITSGSAAYAADGTYVGVGGAKNIAVVPVNRRVSDVESIRVDITGPEAFGNPDNGPDLFAVVQSISTNSAAGNQTALTANLGALDEAISRMTTALADVGTRAERMDNADSLNAARQLTLQTQLSQVEDVDLPKTIMELNMQQTGYQAALQATAKALQPTLLDFLR